MKKFFTLLFLTSALAGFSQTRSIVFVDQQINNFKKPNQVSANEQKAKFKNSRSVESEWVCYIDQVNANNGGTINDDALMHIFPDSTIIWGYDTNNNPVYAQNHAGGTMIDPTFMPDGWLNYNSHYTLDSVAFFYAYTRHTDPSVVDTIHMELIKSIDGQLYTLTTGSEEYQDILYDSVNLVTRPSNVITSWDIPLTEADSSLGDASGIPIKSIAIPTPYSNFSQAARIGVMLSYKPGFTWAMTDSLDNKNAFYLLSSEENGDNTDPTYLGDHNASYSLPNDVRYSISTTGWDGFYLPTWAWQTGFDWEHHYILFKLTSDNVGINESSLAGGALSVYPNPVSENVTIDFTTESASNVNFRISNVAGEELASTNAGMQNAGNHNLNIDLSNVQDGVYFISMETNKGKSIQKIVVVH